MALEPVADASQSGGVTSDPSRIHVREATRADVSALVALNELVYPAIANEDVVWGERHLVSHQRIFPQGQLVAELDGQIVGAVASLIVDLGPDPLRPHTWPGITDSGYFTNHDPEADTLYGADVYVHPEARGLGVGAALYEARRSLCRRLNKRRILAGGRLWGYAASGAGMTPEEYAARVVSGELRDQVLSFQLREGFVLRSVLPNYIHDSRSKNFASLIEWLNPDYRPAVDGERKARIACVQYQMRRIASFEEFAQQVSYFVGVAADYRADFLLLPELVSAQLLSAEDTLTAKEGMRRLAAYRDRFETLMRDLAVKHGITIIAGSLPVLENDRLLNVAFTCLPSGQVVAQPKLHITPTEKSAWGISGGFSLRPIDAPKTRIGVLICYDIEFPEAARYLADLGAEIIFVPFCTDTRQSYLRVRYCAQARAIENQLYVAMAGNVGNLPDVGHLDINYGQAAVLTPSDFAFARDGIAAEADSNEETVLICDVDLNALHSVRSSGTVTPRLDRRADLFRLVSLLPADQASSGPKDGPLGGQPGRS
ncbi:MAG: GNAT family N-acetyltransferase [Myxococcales bacterium]|nr:MAG: GNAT family N-acetyltransferase [Myxococcales bacterium]